jgi:hypothetical protein
LDLKEIQVCRAVREILAYKALKVRKEALDYKEVKVI